MAKAKTLKMIILLLGILLIGGVAYGQMNRQGSAEIEPGSEANGFRDTKWRTDISTRQLQKFRRQVSFQTLKTRFYHIFGLILDFTLGVVQKISNLFSSPTFQRFPL